RDVVSLTRPHILIDPSLCLISSVPATAKSGTVLSQLKNNLGRFSGALRRTSPSFCWHRVRVPPAAPHSLAGVPPFKLRRGDAAQNKKAPRSFEAGRVDLMRDLNAAQPRRFP